MNSEFLHFILAIAIVIAAAKLSGYLSIRLGQPSVLGELLAGILLGPTFLNMLGAWPVFAEDHLLPELLSLMAEIGVVLLMFLAGLELELTELLHSGRVAAFAGVLGVIIPLVGGAATALAFGIGTSEALFIGLALSATSVSISAQTLIELGMLRSRVGLGLLGAAVFDDILVLLFLSTATLVVSLEGEGGVALAVLRALLLMLGYLLVAGLIGYTVIPRLTPLVERLPVSQSLLAFSIVGMLVFAWASEAIGGMAAITGAFIAGLFFARTPAVREIEHGISALAYGFFVPIFFVNIGLEADLRAVSGGAWVFTLVLTVVAILTKIIGSGLGARLGGMDGLDSVRLGIGMVSRGEVGLIVASVALANSVIANQTYSELVFIVIAATIVTPPLLRLAYSQRYSRQGTPSAGGGA
jgi:Kef-type K+ transport system membrane component KefB